MGDRANPPKAKRLPIPHGRARSKGRATYTVGQGRICALKWEGTPKTSPKGP